MSNPTTVQITECGPDGFRRQTHRIQLEWVLRFAEGKVPPVQIKQLRYDISATGIAVLHGDFGRWFEYRVVYDDQDAPS